MITVRDTNNAIHEACPRCSGQWEYLRDPDYIACGKCQMLACPDDRPRFHFFIVDLQSEKKEYTIYWLNGGCLVTVKSVDSGEETMGIDLPLLPFDVTLAKLQT